MAFQSAGLLCVVILVLAAVAETCYGANDRLQPNSYKEKCSSAEYWVRNITTESVVANPSLAAKLLRLHFHDCFVRGCDASVLLDFTPTNQNQTEKVAPPNLSLGGFDVITKIKTKLEEVCPEVVSCADILTLSARDAVVVLDPKARWEVHTGRRDGLVSNNTEASDNLPSSFANFTSLKTSFANKGLNVTDLVALSGAHTIGITHCGAIFTRLYNFTGQGDTDPTLNSDYAKTLKQICPSNVSFSKEVDMDENSAESFDTDYFKGVEGKRGIFRSDAALLDNSYSRFLVQSMQNRDAFFKLFGISMNKMGAIGVLTGNDGEIRKKCNFIN